MVCFGTTIETLLNRRCLIDHCGAGRASAAVSERNPLQQEARFLESDSRRKPSEIPILRHPEGLLSNGSTARPNILTLRRIVVRVTVEMIDTTGVEGARTPDQAVYFIAFEEEKLGKIGTVLAGDACDKSFLHEI